MGKQKLEKILLLVLLPAFTVILFYKYVGKAKQKPQPAAQELPAAAQTDYTKPAEDIMSKIRRVEYQANSLLDPLENKLSAYIANIGATKIKVKPQEIVNPPQLTITGLLWNSHRPQAIVNGRVISAGDEIEGAKLLSVTKDGINIEYKGFEFFINKKQ